MTLHSQVSLMLYSFVFLLCVLSFGHSSSVACFPKFHDFSMRASPLAFACTLSLKSLKSHTSDFYLSWVNQCLKQTSEHPLHASAPILLLTRDSPVTPISSFSFSKKFPSKLMSWTPILSFIRYDEICLNLSLCSS